MADESDETQADETQPEASEPDTDVAVAPIRNGKRQPAPAQHQEMFSQMGQEKITRTMVVPRQIADFDPTYKQRPAPLPLKEEPKTVKDARIFLDNLMANPESIDYKLACYRSQPDHLSDGTTVPHGRLLDCPVMGWDDLKQAICDAWGGEKWRIVVIDGQGRQTDHNCIFLNIDLHQHPAKLKKYAVTIDLDRQTLPSQQPLSFEEQQFLAERKALEHRMHLDELESKSAEAARKKSENERKARFERMLSEKQEKELLGLDENKPNLQLQMLENQLKAQAEQAANDRRMFMEMFTKQGEMIAKIADKPIPVPDTGLKDIVVAMIQSNAQKPPDNSHDKMLAQQMEFMKTNADMVLRVSGKENTQQAQLLNGLLTAVLNKNSGNEMTPDTMIKLIGMGQKQVEQTMAMMGGGESATPVTDFQPELGFWGNAQRALIKGLEQLPALAAQHPALMQKALAMFGNLTPSAQQIAQQAQQLGPGPDMQMPPPLLPMYPQQDQFQTNPPPDQFQTNQPPPMQQPLQQQAPMQQRQPAPAPAQQFQTTPPVVQQQEFDTQAQQPMQPMAQEQEDQGPTPEQRLVDAVSSSMEMCLHGIQDNTEKRDWWEDAHNYWPADFKALLVAQASAEARLTTIRQRCDPVIWIQLVQQVKAAPGATPEQQQRCTAELVKLYAGLNALIDANKPKQVQPVVESPVMQPAPAPTTEPVAQTQPVVTQADAQVAAAISQ